MLRAGPRCNGAATVMRRGSCPPATSSGSSSSPAFSYFGGKTVNGTRQFCVFELALSFSSETKSLELEPVNSDENVCFFAMRRDCDCCE